MDDIVVIDDYMSDWEQLRIQNVVLHEYFNWFYQKSSYFYSNEHKDSYNLSLQSNYIDNFQFAHNLYHPSEGVKSDYFKHFAVLLKYFNLENYVLRRMKVNMTLPLASKTKEQAGIPHVDLPGMQNYLTAIYYATESDGDTIIFDRKSIDDNSEKNIDFWKIGIAKRITPKRGRLVVFDGTRLHAGNWPSTDRPRVVFNINMQNLS